MRIFAPLSARRIRFWMARAHPEAAKIVSFALILFLLGTGFGSGFFASNALLISRAGTQPLLYIYIGSSLFSLLLAGIFYFLCDRFQRKKVFIASFASQGFLLILLWALIQSRPDQVWAYFALRIFLYGVFTLSTMQIWVLAADFYNHFEARRWYPILVAVGVLGDCTGGFLASVLAESWGTANLVLIWAWALILSPMLVLPLRRPLTRDAWRARLDSETAFKSEHPAYAGSFYPKHLVILLLFFWVAYSFFAYGVDFIYNSRALAALTQTDELAAFFGKVTLTASAVVLVYQFFLASRLTQRWGMDRLIFGMPLIFLGGAALVFFWPGLLAAAFAEGMIYFFVEFAAVSLLQPVMNLYPQGMRGRVKMLTEGLGRPAGILVLLLFGAIGPLLFGSYSLAAVVFGAALAFLVFPYFFRKSYRAHLSALLHAPETHLVTNAIQALGEPNKKEMAPELCRLLNQAESLDLKKTIVLTLGKIQSREAFQDIIQIFSVKDESLQIAVLESLGSYKNYESILALFRLLKSKQNVSFQVRMNATRLLTKLVGKKMIPFLLETLDDPDPRVRANALESIGLLKDRKAIPILLPYLNDPNNRVRANAAVALTNFRQTRELAYQVVRELYQSQDQTGRLSALYAIGEMGWTGAVKDLSVLLRSPEKKIRQHAAVALAKMKIPEFREPFLAMLMDSDPDVAIETARHILRFPDYSRMILFEGLAKLSRAQRSLIIDRMEQTPLDFSMEKNLLWEQEQSEGHEAPWSAKLIPREIG